MSTEHDFQWSRPELTITTTNIVISDPVELVDYSVSLPRTLPRIVPNTSEAGGQILAKDV